MGLQYDSLQLVECFFFQNVITALKNTIIMCYSRENLANHKCAHFVYNE